MDGLQIGRIQIPAVIPTVTDSSRSGRAYGSSDCGLWSLQTRHTLKLKRQAIVMAWRWRHVKRACLTWIVWSCLILFGESDTLQSFERCASHFDADVILSFHSTCSSLCAFYAFGCIWKKGVHSQPVSTLLPSRGCRTCLFTFFFGWLETSQSVGSAWTLWNVSDNDGLFRMNGRFGSFWPATLVTGLGTRLKMSVWCGDIASGASSERYHWLQISNCRAQYHHRLASRLWHLILHVTMTTMALN